MAFAVSTNVGVRPTRRAHLCSRERAPASAPAPVLAPSRVILSTTAKREQDVASRPVRRRKRREYGASIAVRAQQLARRSKSGHARACGMLRTHLNTSPHDAHAWLVLGQLVRNHSSSLEVFELGTHHCPDSVHLLHAYAVRNSRAGHSDEASALFRRCLRMNASDGVVWQAYGLHEEQGGNVELAHGLFIAGLQHAPRCVPLWNAYAASLRRSLRHEDAVRVLRTSSKIDPERVETIQMWALSLEALGDFQGADALFRRGIELNPRSVPTLQAAAIFHARRGNAESARELFHRASEVDPSHAPVWHAWACMERGVGDVGRARELFDRGVVADPYSAPMLRAWAAMEVDLGHIDESSDWRATNRKSRLGVGERLHMLRLLLERRSSDDVAVVMKWLDRRAAQDIGVLESVARRGSKDAAFLRNLVSGRSAEDVKRFEQWVADRYAKDRRIGVYLFNWDIQPQTQRTNHSKIRSQSVVPEEWYQLDEIPHESLKAGDESIWYNDNPMDYTDGVHFFAQVAEKFANRAALVFALGSLSVALFGITNHLHELGYSPAGNKVLDEQSNVTPPAGVDAYLYSALD